MSLYSELKKESEFFLSEYDREGNKNITGSVSFRKTMRWFNVDYFKPSKKSEVLIFYKYNRKPRLIKSLKGFNEYMRKNKDSFQCIVYTELVRDEFKDYTFSITFE